MDFLSNTLKSVASNAQKVVEEGKQLLEDVDSNANLYLSPAKDRRTEGPEASIDGPEQDLFLDDAADDDDRAEELRALRNYVRELEDNLELLQEEKGSMVAALRQVEEDRQRVADELASFRQSFEEDKEENRRCFALMEQELAEKAEILQVKSQENDLLKRQMLQNQESEDGPAHDRPAHASTEMAEELQHLRNQLQEVEQEKDRLIAQLKSMPASPQAVIEEAERLAAQQFDTKRQDAEEFDAQAAAEEEDINIDFAPGSKEWQRAKEMAKTTAAITGQREVLGDVEELRAKCAALEEKLQEESATHERLKTEQARAAAAEAELLKEKMEESMGELRALQQQEEAAHEETKEALKAAEDKVAAMEEIVQRLEADSAAHRAAQDALKEAQSRLTAIEALESRVEEEVKAHAEAKVAVDELKAKMLTLEKAEGLLKDEVAAHEVTQGALESLKVQLSEEGDVRAQAQSRVEELESALAEKEDTAQRLRDEAAGHGQAHLDIQQSVDTLTLQLETERAEHEEARGKLDAALTKLSELETDHLPALEARLEQSTQAHAASESQVTALSEEIDSLGSKLQETASLRISDQEKAAMDMQKLTEELQDIKKVKAEAASYHEELEAARRKIAATEDERGQLKQACEDASARANVAEEQSRQLEEQIRIEREEKQKEWSKAEAKFERMKARIKALKESSGDAETASADQNEALQKLRNDLEEAEAALVISEVQLVLGELVAHAVETSELSNSSVLRNQAHELAEEKESLLSRVKALEEEKISVHARLEDSQATIAQLESEAKEEVCLMEEALEKLQTRLADGGQEVLQLKQQNEMLTQRAVEAEKLSSQTAHSLEAHNNTVKEMEQRIEELTAARQLVDEELSVKADVIEELTRERDQSKEAYEALLSSQEDEKKRTLDLEKALEEKSLELEKACSAEDVDALKQELAGIKADHAEVLQTLHEQKDEMRMLLAQKQEQQNVLESKEAALEDLKSQTETSLEEIDSIRVDLDETRHALEEEEQSLAAARAKISELKGELVQANLQRDEAEHLLEQKWKGRVKALQSQHKDDLALAVDQVKGKLKAAEQEAQHRESRISDLLTKLTEAGAGLSAQREEASRELASREDYWKSQLARLEASLAQTHSEELEKARAAAKASASDAGELALYKRKNRVVLKRKDERIQELSEQVETLQQDLLAEKEKTKEEQAAEVEEKRESTEEIETRVKKDFELEMASLKKRNDLLGKETTRLKEALATAKSEKKALVAAREISSPQPSLSQRRRSFDGAPDLESGTIEVENEIRASPSIRTPLKQIGAIRGKPFPFWSFSKRSQLFLILYVAVLHMVILYVVFGATVP